MTISIPGTSAPQCERLANGMQVLLLPSTANQIVSVISFLPLPGAIETESEAGLVSFTAKMLLRGTTKRGSAEHAEAIDSLGTTISCDVTDDFTYGHMVCTSDTFEESMRLYAETMQQPSFEPEEIEKERHSTVAAIRRSEDDKFSFTLKNFMRQLYGDHSYGLPRSGTVESISELRRDQLLEIHGDFFNPGQYLTVCVGNFETAQARRMLEELFVAGKTNVEPFQVPPVTPAASGHGTLSRECEQAFLAMGHHACKITSPDFVAMRVLNTVLGEGMSSRLFTHLRDEKGLAYATGSSFSGLRQSGHLFGYIGTKPESLDIAREGMLYEFERMKKEPVPQDELERSKNYVIGKFLIDHQTNYRRGYYLGYFEMMGLGMSMDEEYPARIAAITAEDVLRVANTYIGEPTITELIPT